MSYKEHQATIEVKHVGLILILLDLKPRLQHLIAENLEAVIVYLHLSFFLYVKGSIYSFLHPLSKYSMSIYMVKRFSVSGM